MNQDETLSIFEQAMMELIKIRYDENNNTIYMELSDKIRLTKNELHQLFNKLSDIDDLAIKKDENESDIG